MARFGSPRQIPRVGLVEIWQISSKLPRLSATRVAWHLYLQALRGLIKSPLTSALALATISVSLMVFAVFILLLENVRDFVADSQHEITMSLYLKDQTPLQETDRLLKSLENEAQIDRVLLRSKNQALELFRTTLGDHAPILDGLEQDNPLPASFEVRFRPSVDVNVATREVAERYAKEPLIDEIRFDTTSLSQLSGLIHTVRVFGTIAILILFVMTAFIISATIQLALHAHREEIDIMQLVGATPGYIRAPFVVEGLIQGFFGALFAIALLSACFRVIRDGIHHSEIMSFLWPGVHFLSPSSVVLIVSTGMLVGMAGSYFAVRKYRRG